MAVDRQSGTTSVDSESRGSVAISDPIDELSAADALALAEEAEAEAAEAAAKAAAARARARAIRSRRQTAESDSAGSDDATSDRVMEIMDPAESTDDSVDVDDDTTTADSSEHKTARTRGRLRRPQLRTVVSALVVVVIVALLAVTGYMMWYHHQVNEKRQREADYAAAARQDVINLMSIDFNKAKEDVQRIVDNATGSFKTDFQDQADTMIKAVQDSKVAVTTSVSAAAVQSMTDDSAVVLVAAASEVTNSTGANKEPRVWRLSVTMARDGSQIKLAKVEFVP
jgi:Mce-associated membrane protein